MSSINEQIDGIIRLHKEFSEGISLDIGDFEGNIKTKSDVERDAILMGFALHFSENMLRTDATLKAREKYISIAGGQFSSPAIKVSLDSAYYSAVRKTTQVGAVGQSVYSLSRAQSVALLEQLGWENTEKNISMLAGHFVLLYNNMDELSRRTGGRKTGKGKKVILILLIIIAIVLLFTVGPFGKHDERSDVNKPASSEEADLEPVYETFGDIKFQVNKGNHAFAYVETYKNLHFEDLSGEDQEEWTNDEKKNVWDNVRYGDDYCTDESLYQDILSMDLIDFVLIEIGAESQINTLDDYIAWQKDNSKGFDKYEDFTLNGVHACKIHTNGEKYESVEICFIYNDAFYLIRPIPIYSDNNELVKTIIKSIKFGSSEEQSSAISWKDASKHVGESVTIKGKVAAVDYSSQSSGKPVFIDIGKAYPESGRVTAVIWEENQSNFGFSPEQFSNEFSVGETIYISGVIEYYDDSYTIDVSSPKQISK